MTVRILFLACCFLSASSSSPISTPQSITWFYANNITSGAMFFGKTLGLVEVNGLIQKNKCRIFHSTETPTTYLGVCNTRAAPKCDASSHGSSVPSTYTFVAASQARVDSIQAALLPMNSSEIIVTVPSGAPIVWGAYGFNFYDTNTQDGLGCYRFEVQYFTDPSWVDSSDDLVQQLERAGEELSKSPVPLKPVLCKCFDYCSGLCFAPSCQPCKASVWNGDKDSCLNPGPLNGGLLCASPAMPCCQPNGTACSLVGGTWCDCKKYPKVQPLFPPLADREFDANQTCVQQQQHQA